MILTCPSCGTQYVVKDGAIPPQGRQVRCASCKHSWHQDPEAAGEMILGPEAEAPEPVEEESVAEAAMIDPSTGPEAEERAYEEAVVEEAVSVGSLVRLLQFEGGEARLVEVTLAEDSPAAETAIAELGVPRDATIVAVIREGHVIVPRGDTVVQGGEVLLLLQY